jgi:hypothetical protein
MKEALQFLDDGLQEEAQDGSDGVEGSEASAQDISLPDKVSNYTRTLYCPEEFLTESGKVGHEAKGKHIFPSFDSNSELILLARHPGGFVAAGSRPNNLQSGVLFVTIEEAPVDTLGLETLFVLASSTKRRS